MSIDELIAALKTAKRWFKKKNITRPITNINYTGGGQIVVILADNTAFFFDVPKTEDK